jgi:hypothetical protein
MKPRRNEEAQAHIGLSSKKEGEKIDQADHHQEFILYKNIKVKVKM